MPISSPSERHDRRHFRRLSLEDLSRPILAPVAQGTGAEGAAGRIVRVPDGPRLVSLRAERRGKTTIINILAGLVLPDAGEARILGRSVVGAPLSLRAEVGVATPNDRSFYWRLTGRQNLDFFAALHGLGRKERRRSIDEALTSVDLAPDADKPFRLYSAGMKQKLLIARALLGKPAVLLLDEPTTHMDPLVRDSLHTIIRERIVGQTKTTILLCTHDLAEAQELADHLIFLNDGIVRGQGSLADLRSALAPHARVELEFAQMPRRAGRRSCRRP